MFFYILIFLYFLFLIIFSFKYSTVEYWPDEIWDIYDCFLYVSEEEFNDIEWCSYMNYNVFNDYVFDHITIDDEIEELEMLAEFNNNPFSYE